MTAIGGRLGLHAPGGDPLGTSAFRRDDAARRVVGAAAADVPRAGGVRRLRDVGGVPGQSLRLRARTSRRSTRRCSSATARTAGSGRKPGWWPAALPFSPALLILWAPGGFRFTCYYYRGAYYKAFWADPPSLRRRRAAQAAICGENSFPLILQNIHRYFLYLALLFLVVLAYDVWKAMWFADPATGAQRVRHRRRHARAGRQRRAARRLHARLPFAPPSGRRRHRSVLARIRRRQQALRLRQPPQPPAHDVGVGQPVLRSAFTDLYVRLCSMGVCTDWRISHDVYQTHEHDVLVIGAGGAGLRAAIEASAAGVTVGLVCKSLLGKAHTVMAEGGVAAALGQRRRSRQLEGPLRRHDARRPVRQQLAHGGAARERGARSRARARGLGRALRSHARRPHPAAQLRRPQSIRGWPTSAIAPASR